MEGVKIYDLNDVLGQHGMMESAVAGSRRRSSTGDSEPPPESSEQAFHKLFASVSDPQTSDHHQRHLALTKNVLYHNEQGWKLVELPLVADMLMVLRDKVLDGISVFADQLLTAVVLCAKPFIRLKSNEELTNPSLLSAYVPTLAQLLSFEILEIQVAAAEALRQFAIGACLTRPGKSKNQALDSATTDDLRLPTRVMSLNVMEETDTVDLIAGVFHDLFPDDDDDEQTGNEHADMPTDEEDRPLTPSTKQDEDTATSSLAAEREAMRSSRMTQLLFPLVDLVYELSSHQRCAEVLVVSGALHYIVVVLHGLSSPQDELLSLCLTTLWNVLELCEEKMKSVTKCASRRELLVQFRLRNATYFLSNEFTVQTLLKTLELLLRNGYRRQDKELRNASLMILLLLARRQRSLDLFYSSGLTACLLSYAMSSELARKSPTQSSPPTADAIVADPHNYATTSDEDLEFKQMLWLLLAAVTTNHADNLQSIVQFRFLDVLFDYATGSIISSSSSASKPAKAAALQAYSTPQLQLLQSTAVSVLIHLSPPLIDHVFEISGHVKLLEYLQAGVSTDDAVLASAWQLFMELAPPTPPFQDELGQLGAVEIAVAAFASPPSRHTYALRRNAIVTCARLCRGHDANRQRFFHRDGVAAVVKRLELDAAHVVLEDNLLVGVLDAVRSCIVGHSASELAFIQLDGVSRLLDVIAISPKAIKNQALAALAEITVNPGAMPSYAAWRSDLQGVAASQLLLRIYADEEAAEEKSMGYADVTETVEPIVANSNLKTSAFRSIATCSNPLVVFPIDATAGDDSTLERPTSPAFARLKDALKAGQATPRASLLELQDGDFHAELNLKAKIHAVLENLSFNCEPKDRLTARELVILEIAKEYPTFKVGEMWQNVQLTLHAEGTRPIYADALYIRKQIEHAYNIAVCTKHAQKEIAQREKMGDEAKEHELFASILRQKQQDEQIEEFHRINKRQNSTMKLHLDAKKTRLEFMKKQDPTAFAIYEREQQKKIEDPPPVHEEELTTLAQKERELRGRLSTIQINPPKPQ